MAASRAGGTGVLDLGFRGDVDEVRRELARLARGASPRGTWGVRWNAWGLADRGLARLADLLPGTPVPLLILAGLDGTPAALRKSLKAARPLAERVLVEAVDVDAAERAARAGADGVVLAGQEAGGRVGPMSAFLLLQAAAARNLPCPWWIRGAFGPDTAAAARFAGATGVVLCEELWLARESPLIDGDRAALVSMDGSETVALHETDRPVRLMSRTDREAVRALEEEEARGGDAVAALLDGWTTRPPEAGGPAPAGQGVAFAATLAERFVTTGAILGAFEEAAATLPVLAAAQAAAPSPLAALLGTRHPVLQGPMTRVSDVPAFAAAVAEHGALPFVALALMRGDRTAAVVEGTRAALGDRPFGVGLLGFVPPELREEQLEVVRAARPRFALIAGGRPSQAAALDALGIATFLHVPSPALVTAFLAEGARRFVLEGRECGGHVGPRSSLVLWQGAVDALLAADVDLATTAVVFAGGIHDELSAAMVRVLSARLAARGAATGVLLGTAYLFTPEAVSTGAITATFQEEAIRCRRTSLLVTGTGHASRCADSAFAAEFRRRRAELLAAGASPDTVRAELELLNVGRLRVASKGLRRRGGDGGGAAPDTKEGFAARLEGDLEPVDEAARRREGMFMLGDLAMLRDGLQPMADLHTAVDGGAATLLRGRAPGLAPLPAARRTKEPVAIVGMSCCFPGGPDLRTFWASVVEGRDQVRDVPGERWSTELFHSDDRRAKDRLYARRGAFLEPVRFDPVRYGIPPATLHHVEPVQLLALEAARRALEDAGFDRRPFPRDRTAVLFGSSGIHDLGIEYAFRTMIEHFLRRGGGLGDAGIRAAVDALRERLPGWTEDVFPGILPNLIAGRVANRLDLRGSNYVIDAACSSSLAAVHAAVEQLRSGSCDVAIAGAVDGTNNAFTFMGFAKMHALTPGGVPRCFDASADGIVLGEGAGALVLKRLADAERDGDDIAAVIRGIGTSSDGRNRSPTAPHPEGQRLALQRAYEDAGIDPGTVGLVEAHATGTSVGDAAEIDALAQVLGRGTGPCAIGSVKSQIGHAKTAAGMAGLVKTALALRHGVLPPTLHVTTPNPGLAASGSRLEVNTRLRPWVHPAPDVPRRAGVSAFGFGGTNFHVVLEAPVPDPHPGAALDLMPRAGELFALARPDRAALAEALDRLLASLDGVGPAGLDRLAAALHADERARRGASGARAAWVATSMDDLRVKAAAVRDAARGAGALDDPRGAWLDDEPPARPEEVAFLFPGQGAQREDMLADLVMAGPVGMSLVEDADRWLSELLPRPLSSYVFPPPAFDDATRAARSEALQDTRVAQPAVGLADLIALDALAAFGVRPAMAAGHSYGEYVALHAAGVYDRRTLLVLSAKRGRAVHDVAAEGAGGMLAVAGGEAEVRAAIAAEGLDLHVANLNAPRQTIVAGPRAVVDGARRSFSAHGLAARPVAVRAAFHTEAVAEASRALLPELDRIAMGGPSMPVFSNVTAAPYPDDVAGVKALLGMHLARPVRWVEQVRAMHAAGARVFVEAGPAGILTGYVKRILEDAPHVAVAVDLPREPGWMCMGRVLGRLFARGLPLDLAPWFAGRRLDAPGWTATVAALKAEVAGRPTDWWVEPRGSRPVRPLPGAPKPVAAAPPVGEPLPMPAPPSPTPPTPSGPGPVPGARPAGDLAAAWQETMNAWIDLQRGQQRLFERMLDMQERLLGGTVAGVPPTGFAPPRVAAPPSPTAGLAPLRVVPAPVLPPQFASAGTPPPVAPKAPVLPSVPIPAAAIAAGPITVAPAASAPGDDDAVPTVETFRADLLAEVSRRTGYPEDLLDPDVPLEAGLGIDSIKVMEIFSALKRYHPFLADDLQDEEEVLETFTKLRTLGAILEHYAARRLTLLERGTTGAAGAAAPSPPPTSAPAKTPPPASTVVAAPPSAATVPSPATPRVASSTAPAAPGATVERRVLRPAAAELPGGMEPSADALALPAGRSVLLLGDGEGIGGPLRAAVEESGRVAFQVLDGPAFRALGPRRWEADLTDPEQMKRIAAALGEGDDAPVGVLVNLLNVDAAVRDAKDPAAAGERVLTALLHAAQTFAPGLRDGGVFLNFTALDGRLGMASRRPLAVAQAASAGFAKSLGREWPGLRVKSVDVDPDIAPEILLAGLAREAGAADDLVEVGLDGEGRWRTELAVEGNGAPARALPLDAKSVVLVTGGARGITATAALHLARETRARMVIVGRSPEPVEGAVDDPGGDAADLRARLVERARAAKRRVAAAAVEEEARAILAHREVASSLAALRAAGSIVEYHSLDVADDAAFEALIDDVHARLGRIDAVIHGAGVIEDRRIEDKSAESLARVFRTKVRPALVLARRLRPESLRFLVFFSSVSGRTGNAGQADYSAANEVLNKLAQDLDRRWKARVVAINWGPWDGGMLSDGLRRIYRERGIGLIEPDAGSRAFLDELRRGEDAPEVVLGVGLDGLLRRERDRATR